ncbi:protein kinase-like protein [Trypanosoma cruzi]|nr:protein kinase-like protein [Trypanosoma cruzi]
MAVGASSRTAQRTPARDRRQVISPDVSGQFRVTTFLSLDAFALQYFSLDDHCATGKEGRMFRAFGVTTWAPRVWDEGVSGVFLDLRGAYNYWKRAEDQAQLPFEC